MVHFLFDDLSVIFETKVLTMFLNDHLNLSDQIDTEKCADIAEDPLAFIPENSDHKIRLIKKFS